MSDAAKVCFPPMLLKKVFISARQVLLFTCLFIRGLEDFVMMGIQTAPAQLFYDFDLERNVRFGHMLRKIAAVSRWTRSEGLWLAITSKDAMMFNRPFIFRPDTSMIWLSQLRQQKLDASRLRVQWQE